MGKAALPASRVGTAVGADVACGLAVGEVEPVLAAGVAVADDPQANNRATNNRTIALGKCLVNFVLNLVSDILFLPFFSATNRDVVSTDRNIYIH